MGKASLPAGKPPPGLGLAEVKAKEMLPTPTKCHGLRVGQVCGEDIDQLQALLSSGV